jgi:membrane protein DedA with SNARE-associated domain
VVGAGWYFAGHIEELKRELHWVELAVALAAAIGAVVWVVLARRRERRAAGER